MRSPSLVFCGCACSEVDGCDWAASRVRWRALWHCAMIGRKWQPVVRFDTAHGRSHMDISHPDGWQESRTFPFYDYGAALTCAINYIQEHWESWQESYEEKA